MELEINAKLASLAAGSGPASERAVALAEMFGIGLDERHEVTLYEGFRVKVRRGDVVYITGPSGCGKTVLLRQMENMIREATKKSSVLSPQSSGAAENEEKEEAAKETKTGDPWVAPTKDNNEEDPEGPVAALESVDLSGPAAAVERFGENLDEVLRLASVAGLSDAFFLLRPPEQLSDGQRYRFRLAALLAGGARTIVIDEFCSTLDRRTAKAVAYRLRKYADRTGATFLVATAHDDLIEDLSPDVLIRKRSGKQVEIERR
jgi:hypothetical protein